MRKLWPVLFGIVAVQPVAAQEVQHLDFSTSQSNPAQNQTGLENELREAFDNFGPTEPTQENALNQTARVSVPLWLSTGVIGDHGLVADTYRQPSYNYATSNVSQCNAAMPMRRDISRAAQERRERLYPLAASIACEYGVSPYLFDALIVQESRYNAGARSHVGASGLTQLMPATARELGVSNRWDIEQNLRGGAVYLSRQIQKFGRIDLALAAYNSGPGRVERLGRIPNIRETQGYVRSIMSALAMYERQMGQGRAASIAPAPQRTLERLSFGSR